MHRRHPMRLLWASIPTGRVNSLRNCVVWVQIPPCLPGTIANKWINGCAVSRPKALSECSSVW